MAVAIRDASVTKEERDLVSGLWTKGDEVPEHIHIVVAKTKEGGREGCKSGSGEGEKGEGAERGRRRGRKGEENGGRRREGGMEGRGCVCHIIRI